MLADGLVRLAISNVALRHGTPESIATDLADLFSPYIEAVLTPAQLVPATAEAAEPEARQPG
ncbi:hypothetical protein [Tsukamurella soli]|uniref:hypothetical protein n=1 Tax=Tsukamurella soli TaxID=644556 RepID=UPI003620A68D